MDSSRFDENPMICFCHAVRFQALIAAIRAGAVTLYDIQSETMASTGCGGCQYDILEILESELKRP
jgi:nitrite reductase (NADH) large subunit